MLLHTIEHLTLFKVISSSERRPHAQESTNPQEDADLMQTATTPLGPRTHTVESCHIRIA